MIEKFIAILEWLRNFISPVLNSLLIGTVFYFSLDKNLIGKILGLSVIILGFVLGVVFAEKVRTKVGTHHFNAQNMATPNIKKIKRINSRHLKRAYLNSNKSKR